MATKRPKRTVIPGSKLPVVGKWLTRLGRIHDVFATPESPTPEIWAKALFYSLPRLLFIPVKPFLLATEWHIRTNKSHRRLKGIARVGAEFASKSGPHKTPGWAVFQVAGDLALKAEWYLFLIDRTLEFLTNWTSLAYVYSGSKFAGSIFWEGTKSGGILINFEEERFVGPFIFINQRGQQYIGGTVSVPKGWSGAVKYTVALTPEKFLTIPKGTGYTVKIKDFATGQFIDKQEASVDANGFAAIEDAFFFESETEKNHEFGMIISGPLGAYHVDNITFGIYGFHTGEKGLLFDP